MKSSPDILSDCIVYTLIADELALPSTAEGAGISFQEVALTLITNCTDTEGRAISAPFQLALFALSIVHKLVLISIAKGTGVALLQEVIPALTAHSQTGTFGAASQPAR